MGIPHVAYLVVLLSFGSMSVLVSCFFGSRRFPEKEEGCYGDIPSCSEGKFSLVLCKGKRIL